MIKGEFIELLKQPHLIDEKSINSLQNLVSEYPYFQSSRLLLSKAFHTSGNLNFESTLKKTAAYAANRKRLHQLLFSNVQTDVSSKVAPAINKEEVTIEELKTPELIENIETGTITPPLPPVVESIDAEEVVSESVIREDTPISQPAVSEEQAQINETDDVFSIHENLDSHPEGKLEQQILSSAINSSILLDVSDEIPDIEELTPAQKEEVSEEPKKNITSTFEEETHSFSDWIKHFGDEPEQVESVDTDDTEFEEFDDNNTPIENTLPEKTEFYSPVKMAKLSVQEDLDLVTETLASIYADQGNFEKAIQAFEKLQLKYPEKSIYFAGRIKEIQNKLNT